MIQKSVVSSELIYILLVIGLASTSFDLAAQSLTVSSNNTGIIIDSKILHEKLNAFVYLPEGYTKSTAKYPVVYVLDGETFFTLASEASVKLLQAGTMPACIIIGITSHNRQRDFTTPVSKDAGQPNDITTSGGAERFLEYLEKELIPTIESTYRTQPFRVIIGHSLGGLLVYHALYTKPMLFQAHVSIDGSLWWNKGAVGKAAIQYLTQHPQYKGRLFECRKDISQPVRFPVNTELLQYLAKNKPLRLDYKYLELKNETHATIVSPGIYNGLGFVFKGY